MLVKSIRQYLVPAQAGSPGQPHVHSCPPDDPPNPPGNPPGDAGGGAGNGGPGDNPCPAGMFLVMCRPEGAFAVHDYSQDYPICVDCNDAFPMDNCSPDFVVLNTQPYTCP